MASALVVLTNRLRLLLITRQRIDQRRLADTGRAEQRDRLSRLAPRPQDVDLVSVPRIERLDEDPGC